MNLQLSHPSPSFKERGRGGGEREPVRSLFFGTAFSPSFQTKNYSHGKKIN
jgi:hypothetical protein